MQVTGEHRDRLVFGLVAQLAEQVGFQAGVELDLPSPAHHLGQPLVGGAAAVGDAEALADHAFARVHAARGLVADLEADAEDALVASAEDRQCPVRGRVLQHLVMFEVVAELGAFGFLAWYDAGTEGGVVLEEAPQLGQQVGVLGEALHEDVLGAFEHGLHIGEALLSVDKTGGFAFRIQLGIAEQRIGQLAETGFQGDLALGAALLLVGQVEVFDAGLGVGEVDLALELGGQLALFLDAGEDRDASLVQLAQVAQALFQVTQLGIVEAAGDFLAIAGDEGNGGAFVEQRHGGGDLLRAYAQLVGDTGIDAVHVVSCGRNDGRPARKAGKYNCARLNWVGQDDRFVSGNPRMASEARPAEGGFHARASGCSAGRAARGWVRNRRCAAG